MTMIRGIREIGEKQERYEGLRYLSLRGWKKEVRGLGLGEWLRGGWGMRVGGGGWGFSRLKTFCI